VAVARNPIGLLPLAGQLQGSGSLGAFENELSRLPVQLTKVNVAPSLPEPGQRFRSAPNLILNIAVRQGGRQA